MVIYAIEQTLKEFELLSVEAKQTNAPIVED